jgi:hypothetical protein
MNGSILGLSLINGWYIPWVNPDKQMVHSLGQRVERDMRMMVGVVVGVVKLQNFIYKCCDVVWIYTCIST